MNKKYNCIREHLKARGISQKWLAEKVGVSYNAMSAICNNRSQPKIPLLYKIADALEVNICELLVNNANKELNE